MRRLSSSSRRLGVRSHSMMFLPTQRRTTSPSSTTRSCRAEAARIDTYTILSPASLLAALQLLEPLPFDLLGRLALAVLLGGIVGVERELSGKPAGLRTNIRICLGSALLTDLSLTIGITDGVRTGGPARSAAPVGTGVGRL